MMNRNRFQVSVENPFRVRGGETYFETEMWKCCREWEVVIAKYEWSNRDEMWKREEQMSMIRRCGICGSRPSPPLDSVVCNG